jgi:hypothetical protein
MLQTQSSKVANPKQQGGFQIPLLANPKQKGCKSKVAKLQI